MKTHITMLQKLQSISVLLAARSLFWFEGEYDHGEGDCGLRVINAPDRQNTRLAFLDGFDDPVLLAADVNDELIVTASNALEQSPMLCALLAALGFQGIKTDDGYKLQTTFSVGELGKNEAAIPKVEALWNRMVALDTLWMANRRLSQFDQGAESVATNLVKVFEKANSWSACRLADLEAEISSGRTVAAERVEAKLLEDLQGANTWGIPGVEGIEIEHDPRGSAFELKFAGSYGLRVMPMMVAWPVKELFGETTKKQCRTISKGKYALTPTKIKPEVLAVLDGLVVEGMTVRIGARLSKALYAKVNEMLNTIGGRWHTGAQAHVFEDDPKDLLKEMVATGAVYTRKDFEFFESTNEVVPKVIALAELEYGMKTMEPSAGRAALALPAAHVVGLEHVTCYELMERNVLHLQSLGFAVNDPQDFLEVTPQPIYDRVVMNPPFSGGRDAAHIQHAYGFLKPGGRLVAVASTQWQSHTTAPAKAFKAFIAKWGGHVEQIAAGAFKESGTDVATTLIVLCKPLVQQERIKPPQTAKAIETAQVDMFAF